MILIVQSLWSKKITQQLADGATRVLKEQNVAHELVQVPGALEIPLAIKWAWSKSQREQSPFFGAIACGCVIKGETYHFDIVANESARALMNLSVDLRLPIGNAILCVYDHSQAEARCDLSKGKGAEAALTVLEMLKLKQEKKYL